MKLTPAQSRRALGFGLIGIGGPIAGPAMTLFSYWLPGRRKGFGWVLFDLPPHVVAALWVTFGIGAALAIAGLYLIKSAKRL